MPILTLNINAFVPDEAKFEVAKELSSAVGTALGKPEMYMCVHIIDQQTISFAGNNDPAGYAVLKSIGGVGSSSENNTIADLIFPIVQKHFGIPGNRFYTEFVNLGAKDIAFNGKTFG